jgi:hypothetical protein
MPVADCGDYEEIPVEKKRNPRGEIPPRRYKENTINKKYQQFNFLIS